MVEAEERQKAIHRLTFSVASDVIERGLVNDVECQRLTQKHLTVSTSFHHLLSTTATITAIVYNIKTLNDYQ